MAEQWCWVTPELRRMAYALGSYAHETFGVKQMVVTSVWRSESENRAVGGNPASLHRTVPVRALDIRRTLYSDDQIAMLKAYWNNNRPHAGYDFVIETNHIHLEIDHRADEYLASLALDRAGLV